MAATTAQAVQRNQSDRTNDQRDPATKQKHKDNSIKPWAVDSGDQENQDEVPLTQKAKSQKRSQQFQDRELQGLGLAASGGIVGAEFVKKIILDGLQAKRLSQTGPGPALSGVRPSVEDAPSVLQNGVRGISQTAAITDRLASTMSMQSSPLAQGMRVETTRLQEIGAASLSPSSAENLAKFNSLNA